MKLAGKGKQLLDYFNEHNSFIQITEDDVDQEKREYDKYLKKAFTWITAKKDDWNISCEHQGEGNFGNENQEITITIKKTEKVGDFFGEDRSGKSLDDAIMNLFKK